MAKTGLRQSNLPGESPEDILARKRGYFARHSAISANVKELARMHTPEAIETLVAIMRSPKTKGTARVQAANSLLDRAYGKPAQQVELTQRSIESMPTDELLTRAKSIIEKRLAEGEPMPDMLLPK